ncbi:MAG: hypothetical protein J3Q66DRAFT_445385 [Benniella sp.]|nr:MAG: hypothetical protein J3Q66DRAFT_445385 [Benniella sp.]
MRPGTKPSQRRQTWRILQKHQSGQAGMKGFTSASPKDHSPTNPKSSPASAKASAMNDPDPLRKKNRGHGIGAVLSTLDHNRIFRTRTRCRVKSVTQTLAKNTERLLVQTVHKEIHNVVVPLPDLNVLSVTESALSENVLMAPVFANNLTTQTAAAIRPSIEDPFKDWFTNVLALPFQRATQDMFQQLYNSMAHHLPIERTATPTGNAQKTVDVCILQVV